MINTLGPGDVLECHQVVAPTFTTGNPALGETDVHGCYLQVNSENVI